MTITYYGHGCLGIATQGLNLLVDPFIRPNDLASQIEVENIPVDYILLTHGHGDHVADVEEIATRTKATIIANYEVATYYGAKGFTAQAMNHGGKVQHPFGTLKYVNAVHSSMLPDGSDGGDPGGFVLWNEEACIYIAGDTALCMDMKLIPMTCPKLNLAIFPIGDVFTMGYEDAVIAAQFVECDRVMGYHYDTFPPIKLDKEAAQKAFADAGKDLILPLIGETTTV